MASKKKKLTKGTIAMRGAGAKRFGWAGLIIFVLTLAISLSVVGYGTNGFKDWGFNRFAQKSEAKADETVKADSEGMVLGTSDNTNGVALASRVLSQEEYAANAVGAGAENVYVLRAEVIPAEATFDAVEFSGGWKNPNSEWATGKAFTDYIEVKQDATDNHKATVSCKKEFREPAIITVTSVRNNNIKTTVQADYVGKVLYRSNWGGNSDLENGENVWGYPENINSGVTYIYQGHTGTIAPDLENCVAYRYFPFFTSGLPKKVYDRASGQSYEMPAAAKFFQERDIIVYNDVEDAAENQWYMPRTYSGTISFDGCSIGDEITTPSYFYMMCEALGYRTDAQKTKLKNAISKYLLPNSSSVNDVEIWLGSYDEANRKLYNGKIYGDNASYEAMLSTDSLIEIEYGFDSMDVYCYNTDGLEISVSDIIINQDPNGGGLVFG